MKNVELGKTLPWVIAVLILIVGISISSALRETLEEEQVKRINVLLETQAELIRETIVDNVSLSVIAIQRMAQRWTLTGGTPYHAWQNDAKNYVKDFPALTTVEWIDSSYHVAWIEPLLGNEKAVGLDIVFDEERKRALKNAAEKNVITMTPPLDLTQGYRAFITYSPVFKNQQFDGFIAGIFDLTQFMDVLIDKELRKMLSVEIMDKQKVVYQSYSSTIVDRLDFQQKLPVPIFNREWQLKIIPNNFFMELHMQQSQLHLVIYRTGLIISVLLSMAVFTTLQTVITSSELKRTTKALEYTNKSLEATSFKLEEKLNELQEKNLDLRRIYQMTAGRELKMIQLKKEVNELSSTLGLPEPYEVVIFED